MQYGRILALTSDDGKSDGWNVGKEKPSNVPTFQPSIREGQTFAGESLLLRYINFVKLPHTVFALPFALLGVVVASYRQPVTWRGGGLVVLAVTARGLVAMGFKRIAHRRPDPRHPRTQRRELPAGPLAVSPAGAGGLFAVGG